ncbi:MAG: hypothetical protein H7Y13_00095 [Sphingobacteriaceae bacterium]|nr:hypothetical protein [Sphingobacteriaceae bacterium]
MKPTHKLVTKTILTFVFIFVTISTFSQKADKTNPYYRSVKNGHSLNSIFPVDDIESITVTNYHASGLLTNDTQKASYALTEDELNKLKKQFKDAKFAGGLLVKPGDIMLSVKLKATSKAKTGSVYAYKGNINFDRATDRNGNKFSGTYYLPLAINFDNYK